MSVLCLDDLPSSVCVRSIVVVVVLVVYVCLLVLVSLSIGVKTDVEEGGAKDVRRSEEGGGDAAD